MSELIHVPALFPVLREDNTVHPAWLQFHVTLAQLINSGYPPPKNLPSGKQAAQSVTVPIAKLTVGGTNGSLTFTNGILTSVVDPT